MCWLASPTRRARSWAFTGWLVRRQHSEAAPDPPVALAVIRSALRVEDVLLGGVNLVAPWLLAPVPGSPSMPRPSTGLGLVMLLSLAGAVASIGLRPVTRQPALRAAGRVQTPRYALVGPLLGALWLVGGLRRGAIRDVGRLADRDPGGAGAAGLAAAGGNRFLPEVAEPEVRRALVTPFILVCTGIFLNFAGSILGGLDVGAMIREAPAVGTSFALFVAIMLLGGLAAFYAHVRGGPLRELADPENRHP